LALVLSSIGVYGVISYLVGQRTHEIGIRMAMGARRADVLRLVLGESLRMAGVGVLIGLAAASGLTRLMSKMLFGVKATDPLTFAGLAVMLTLVALTASLVPALKAIRASIPPSPSATSSETTSVAAHPSSVTARRSPHAASRVLLSRPGLRRTRWLDHT
jgi:predicted lysophospholipase L1 biosynthesis ABC-type transport system permease subunit